MPNRNIYEESFRAKLSASKSPQDNTPRPNIYTNYQTDRRFRKHGISSFLSGFKFKHGIFSKLKVPKPLAYGAGLAVLVITMAVAGLAQYQNTKNQEVLGVLQPMAVSQPSQVVFDQILRGNMIFTGNSLMYSNPAWPCNNTGGAFVTTNRNQRTGTYPQGSTLDWRANGSSAQLNLPPGSQVIYAELIWGGSRVFPGEDLTQASLGPITLTTPSGTSQVSPAAGRGGNIEVPTFSSTNQSQPNYYVRSQTITDQVRAGGSGTYTVSGVPATINANNDNYNNAGWTLAVVYGDLTQPNRKINLNVVSQMVVANNPGQVFGINGFSTPDEGPVKGNLLLSAQEGDTTLFGDEFRFGATEAALQNNNSRISTPNNPVDNFFGSQINGANGRIDVSGTNGSINEDYATANGTCNVRGNRRHGWDITTADISSRLSNSQTTAFAQGTSQSDGYAITAVGFAIETNAPNPQVVIERDKDTVRVGQTIKYTITVNNTDGIITANSVRLTSLVPPGTSVVPGSLTVDGQPASGDPINGFDLANMAPKAVKTITYEVKVDSIPPSNVFENDAAVAYSFVPTAGAQPVQDKVFSNRVITVPLQGQAQPPVAVDDAISTRPNTPVTIPILVNDQNPYNPNNTVAPGDLKRIVTQPTNGTVTIQPNTGNVVYVPNPGFTGPTDTFRYEICNQDGCSQANVTVTINNPQPPVATDDTATTKQGTPVDLPILTNDQNPKNPNGAVTPDNFRRIVTQPTNGTVTVNPTTGVATYTPNPNFTGPTDTFRYEICNVDGCSQANGTITVQPKQPPVATDDTATTKQGTPVDLPILNNDNNALNPDGKATPTDYRRIVTQPTNGTITVNPTTGVATYTPNPNFTGPTDTFRYEICNADGCSQANGTITVTPKQPPVATDDTATTKQDTPVQLPILTNDRNPLNPNNQALPPDFTRIVTQPTNGTITVDNGVATYTPNPGFTGPTDTFRYEICNVDGCSQANGTITVTPKRPPQATDDAGTVKPGESVNVPILTNDRNPLNPNNQALPPDFTRIVTPPVCGQATVDPATGQLTYTAGQTCATPTDTLRYEICNVDGCSQANVVITISPKQPPVANPDTATTKPGNPVSLPILSNDQNPLNPDGKATLPDFKRITQQPTNGTVTVDPATGLARYTPNTGFTGPTDSFKYEICNRDGCSETTATINITPLEPPVANPDAATTKQDTPVQLPILTNDTNPLNPDGKATPTDFKQITQQPEHGTITQNPTTKVVTYTPNPGYVGQDTFKYQICNADGCSETTGTITVGPLKPPIATNDKATAKPGDRGTVPILNNDQNPLNPDGKATPPDFKRVVEQGRCVHADFMSPTGLRPMADPMPGDLVYTVDPNCNLTSDSIVYEICNTDGCAQARVLFTLSLPPVQDPNPNQNTNNPPRGQVLGAYENRTLPRTGGFFQNMIDMVLGIGLLLAGGFFGSIYFVKTKSTHK